MARPRMTTKQRLEELHSSLRLAKHVEYQGRYMATVRRRIEAYFDACTFSRDYDLSPLELEMFLYAYGKRPSLPTDTVPYVVSKLALLMANDDDK